MAKHLGGDGELTGVVALGPSNVWVFGGSGFGPGLGTWHFNGRSWSQWHGNAVGLQGGSALSAAKTSGRSAALRPRTAGSCTTTGPGAR